MFSRRALLKTMLAAIFSVLALALPTMAPAQAHTSAIAQDGPPADRGESGDASWYGDGFDGRPTASQRIFHKDEPTCAHRTLPFGTKVTVEVLETGAKMDLEVTDRGPFVPGRIVDVSEAAAEALGFHDRGVTRVRITVKM